MTYRDFLSEDEQRPGILYFGGARVALLDIDAGFWALRPQMEALVGRRLTDAVLQQLGPTAAPPSRVPLPPMSPQKRPPRRCVTGSPPATPPVSAILKYRPLNGASDVSSSALGTPSRAA